MNFVLRIIHTKPIWNHKNIWFLLVVGLLFSILRIPSLVEPYWYGDEGIYQVIGQALNQGRFLYLDIWDNKPPLLYLIYGVFNGELYYVKLMSLIVGLLSVIGFFYLSQKLFKKKNTIYFTTALFAALFALPLLEGNIANAENFMMLPTILAAYVIILYKGNKKTLYLVTAGLLLSVSFLLKIVAVFDFVAFFIFLTIIQFDSWTEKSNSLHSLLKKIRPQIIFAFAFSFLFLLSSIFFFVKGAFSDFFMAVISQNIDYVGVGNDYVFPMGFLTFKVIAIFAVVVFILIKRKTLGFAGLFIYLWLALSIFNSFFSQRPYTHYILVILPAFSLFVGYIIEYKKKVKLNIFIAAAIVTVVYLNFDIYTKISPYYINYLQFITGNKSVNKYQEFFDKRTPRDYDLARFIKANADEGIFVLTDSGQIYALSNVLPPGKFIVAYHITFYDNAIKDTIIEVEKRNPRYIIQTEDSELIERFIDSYDLKYSLGDANIYEKKTNSYY